jgi:predicted molibdopterin-dependent oxidoreductase YjgC
MAAHSDLFMRLRPGTDIALLNSIAHVIVREGLEDKEFIGKRTKGFNTWIKSLEKYTPAYAEEITGIPAALIEQAARIYGGSRKAGIFYTMGITQHICGTDNVSAIANLALLTGNVGRDSAGVNPLRGQNNVQGACDMGALPNIYPGYQKVDDPAVKDKFQKIWDVTNLSSSPGMAATEMIDAADDGSLKAMYIMGENPALSDPDIKHTRKALKKLDFLVVQDIFLTETAYLADVVFPAAAFAEKDGTFTNTERRVQLVRKALRAPGQARSDHEIIISLMASLGFEQETPTPAEVFEEVRDTWEAVEGISHNRIEKKGIQWPCPDCEHPGTEVLHKGGFKVGKAPFSSVEHIPSAEGPDNEYPFLLTTGRNLFQYHTGTMTRRVMSIEKHAGEAYMEISRQDARRLGIEDGQRASVASRRGEINLSVRVSDTVDDGTVFIPMHYAEAAANALTNTARDPKAKIPELKVCAVKIAK